MDNMRMKKIKEGIINRDNLSDQERKGLYNLMREELLSKESIEKIDILVEELQTLSLFEISCVMMLLNGILNEKININ